MAHTHSHDDCDCHHDHQHTHTHNHEHSHDCCDHHETGFLNLTQRWIVSGLMVMGLLFLLRSFILDQLFVRETSYAANLDYTDAVRICHKMIVLDPNNTRAWDSLGYAYLDRSQLDQAAEAFQKVLQLNPEEKGAASYELGEIYFSQGNYPQAINYFERIRSLGPKASTILEADILKYRHGTLGFRNLNSMQNLLQHLSAAYQKIGDVTNASVVGQEYEYYKAHQSKVLF